MDESKSSSSLSLSNKISDETNFTNNFTNDSSKTFNISIKDNIIDTKSVQIPPNLPRRKLQEPDDIDAPDDCLETDWENHNFPAMGNPHPLSTDVDYFSSQVLYDLLHKSETSKLSLVHQVKALKKELLQQQIDFEDMKRVLNNRIEESYNVIEDLESQLKQEQEQSFEQKTEMQAKLDNYVEEFTKKEEIYVEKLTKWEEKTEEMNHFETTKATLEKQLDESLTAMEVEKIQAQKQLKTLESETIIDRAKLRRQFEIKIDTIESMIETEIQQRLRRENYQLYEDYKRIRQELVLQSGDSIRLLMGRRKGAVESMQNTSKCT
jgi:hypothetical protein